MGACFGKRKEVIEAPFYQKRGAMMLRTHSSTILKEINKDFDLGNVLGTGHFGVVRKANYKDNPSYFVAIKTIEKSKVNKLMD